MEEIIDAFCITKIRTKRQRKSKKVKVERGDEEERRREERPVLNPVY